MYARACHRAHILRSEDNLWQSILSLHHVGPGNRTQIIRVGGKCLYQMSHLGAPEFPFLGKKQKSKQQQQKKEGSIIGYWNVELTPFLSKLPWLL